MGLKQGVARASRALGRVLHILFGELRWHPPQWVRALGAGGAAAMRRAQARPVATAALLAALLALTASGALALRWMQLRPKPVLTTFEVAAPARTCLECEPPGKPQPLIVTFSQPVAPLDAIGQAIHGGVELSPRQAGAWRWDSDRRLRFEPAADWPAGATYRVRFDARTLLRPGARLKESGLRFSAAPFEARILARDLHHDPSQRGQRKAVITISFTHPVMPADFEQKLSLQLVGQTAEGKTTRTTTAYTVLYDKLHLNAFVHSAPLPILAQGQRLELRLDAGLRPAAGGNAIAKPLSTAVDAPGLDSLKVAELRLDFARNDRDVPEQVLLLRTTDTVTEEDMSAHVHAWVLPLQHPDPERQRAWRERQPAGQQDRPFDWSSCNCAIDAAVLGHAKQAPLGYVANEQAHVALHGLRYQAEPGRFLLVRVDKGLRSFGGYRLGQSVDAIQAVPAFPQQVRITSMGSLLALSGQRKLTVLARDVRALRVELAQLLPGQLQHLVTQSQGTFSQPEFWNECFDASNLTSRQVRKIRLPALPPGTAHYEVIDFSDLLQMEGGQRRGTFLLKVSAMDPDADVATAETDDELTDTRLIVVTDLGLIAKRSVNGEQDVFVQSILNGAPMAGVVVEVMARNGTVLLSQTTDAAGRVHFPDLAGFRDERAPALYLARKMGDSAFLPIGRVSLLDLTRFDVGGVEEAPDPHRLNAYLFSDRGIYRPGEEIRIGSIVRSQDWQQALAGIPLTLEVSDPRGIVVKRERLVLSATGFEDLRYTTQAAAPTGVYTFSLSIPEDPGKRTGEPALIGSTTVKVQEFEPDRLKMSVHLSRSAAPGWVSPEDLQAQVALQNLFGSPAQNRRITARMTLTPAAPVFAAYADYRFTDPQAAKQGFSEALAETVTDAAGSAQLDLRLQRFARATYRLHLVTQGFEADGGRGVTAETEQLVSNLPFLIGQKPDGDLAYIPRGTARQVELMAIDPQLRRTDVAELELRRIERKVVSVLTRLDDGRYRYVSRLRENVLETHPLTLPAAGFRLPLATDLPGQFSYVVTDRDGQAYARVDYAVAGSANLSRSLEKNAELLIALNKRDYAPGEEIEMQITAPYTGAGLITIERDKVYASQWFKTDTTASVQRIRVPEGLEGNAYVSVSFVRDPGSPEIYTSPLSYGVQPFSVDRSARRNPVTLRVPERIKPGEELVMHYRTARPARIVLFAVDEGILQVARYKTADPLGYFFQKRALGVATTQILDLILPEFRAEMIAAAPGGDEDGGLGRFLNPFKRRGDPPVAFWSAILDADEGERSVRYTVPESFNGSLRVMAVAVAADTIGVAEANTLVRGDFVLSPNAPTTVTPGDTFEVSTGVANNLAGSGAGAQVTVSLAASPHFEIIGPSSQRLAIAEQQESVARFRVRARDQLGAARLTFSARLGDHTASQGIGLGIRPPTPFRTQIVAGRFDAKQVEVTVPRTLYPDQQVQEASVSRLPLGLSHGLVQYLGHYEYACTEQLISMAVPTMVLGQRPEFGYVRQMKGASLDDLVGRLRARQTRDGGYGRWSALSAVDDWASVYAQHFWLEARDRGQRPPQDLIESGNGYLRELAGRAAETLDEARVSSYAIYLLARQGIMVAHEAAGLQARLEHLHAKAWEQDLSAAYLAAAYRLMKQEQPAQRLMGRLGFDAPKAAAEDGYGVDPLTRNAQLLYLQARHFPERLEKLPPQALGTLVDGIRDNRYQSLSAAWIILALDAYASATAAESAPGDRLAIAELSEGGGAARPLRLSEGLFPKAEFSSRTRKLRFSHEGPLGAYYQLLQAGFDRGVPDQPISQGFEIVRAFTDAAGKPIETIRLGDEVTVHLRFRALQDAPIRSVALVDLLPGGFELVIPSSSTPEPVAPAVADATDEEEADDESNGEAEDAEEQAPAAQAYICAICTGSGVAALEYADVREDRVVFYTTLTQESQELIYRIKAIAAGSFNLPPAYGEALYAPESHARSRGGQIVIEPQPAAPGAGGTKTPGG